MPLSNPTSNHTSGRPSKKMKVISAYPSKSQRGSSVTTGPERVQWNARRAEEESESFLSSALLDVDLSGVRLRHTTLDFYMDDAKSTLTADPTHKRHKSAVSASEQVTSALAELEELFRQSYYTRYAHLTRQSMIVLTILWAVFTILDIVKAEQGERADIGATIGIRVFGCCLGVGYVLVASSDYFHVDNSFAFDITSVVVLMLFGIFQIIFGIIEESALDPAYSVVMVLLFACAADFFRLRFVPTLTLCFSTIFMYTLLVTNTGSYKKGSAYLGRWRASDHLLCHYVRVFITRRCMMMSLRASVHM
jgi:hypothetical protein